MKQFNIGLDIHGVINTNVDFFKEMARIFVAAGHNVHILTGSRRDRASNELSSWGFVEGVHYTHFFSILDWHESIGTLVVGEYIDDDLWNKSKSQYCERNSIDFHVDDTPEYQNTFKTPFSLFKTNAEKIAIIGGAFDPPTKMHIDIAKYIMNNTDCDKVWLLPCYTSRHGKNMTDPSIRMEMLHAACAELDGVTPCDYEIVHQLDGKTYDLMNSMSNTFSNKNFRFVIGQDNAEDIFKWYRGNDIINDMTFMVFPREGITQRETWYLHNKHMFLKDAEIAEGSSSAARQHIGTGNYTESMNYIIEPVLDIIQANDLYVS